MAALQDKRITAPQKRMLRSLHNGGKWALLVSDRHVKLKRPVDADDTGRPVTLNQVSELSRFGLAGLEFATGAVHVDTSSKFKAFTVLPIRITQMGQWRVQDG